jgi:hypothetical protein
MSFGAIQILIPCAILLLSLSGLAQVEVDGDGIPACSAIREHNAKDDIEIGRIPDAEALKFDPLDGLSSKTPQPSSKCECDLTAKECTAAGKRCEPPDTTSHVSFCVRTKDSPRGDVKDPALLKCIREEREIRSECGPAPECASLTKKEALNCVICRYKEYTILSGKRERGIKKESHWTLDYDCEATSTREIHPTPCKAVNDPGKDGLKVENNCSEEPDASGECGGQCSGIPLEASNNCRPDHEHLKVGLCKNSPKNKKVPMPESNKKSGPLMSHPDQHTL